MKHFHSSRRWLRIFLPCLIGFAAVLSLQAADTARQTIVKAMIEEDDEKKIALINSLIGSSDEDIKTLLAAWKEDTIYIYKAEADGSPKVPVFLAEEKDAEEKQAATLVLDGTPLKGPDGQPLKISAAEFETAEHDSNIRGAMKAVLDLLALASPDREKRIQAINTLGMNQEAEKLPALLAAQKTEKDDKVKRAYTEAIALIQLKDEDPKVQVAAIETLGKMGSIPSRDFLTALERESKVSDVIAAAQAAQKRIASHITAVNFWGTAFRGLSLGSVLLVVALGLAITFGLMGVINMAHGEVMAVGAYATYIVQNIFGSGLAIAPFGIPINIPGLSPSGTPSDFYFIVALPFAFLSAALVGIALERGVIRFLYRRPLESLLATWGVSLVLQQLFRMVFGANNVQVYSPSFLSGNWTVGDVILGWNRVFVIGFAILIVVGTHLALTRTPLGLLIRAVMQNRQMAACMGVKTERVNMLTFGLGSGLAGLAGAFLSQIGNVGPSLGQSYIVDCFMTVVVGGVGNIIGTVISALGIGIADQSLQQLLGNPVLGKILVLGMIILFLQWKPAGLFVTKSRSLES
jgi:urea transport system permease protein